MTISELMRLLDEYPPDMRVVVNGYEEGYDDLSQRQISVVKIQLNTGTHDWQGQHGDPHDKSGQSPDDAAIVDALVLRRMSYL